LAQVPVLVVFMHMVMGYFPLAFLSQNCVLEEPFMGWVTNVAYGQALVGLRHDLEGDIHNLTQQYMADTSRVTEITGRAGSMAPGSPGAQQAMLELNQVSEDQVRTEQELELKRMQRQYASTWEDSNKQMIADGVKAFKTFADA
jgi:hypothetical protein